MELGFLMNMFNMKSSSIKVKTHTIQAIRKYKTMKDRLEQTCLSVVKQMFVQQLVSSGVRPC